MEKFEGRKRGKFNLRVRWCHPCQKTHFSKPGEIHSCIKYVNQDGTFNVYKICDKCLSVLYPVKVNMTHRIFYPGGCIREQHDLNLKRIKYLHPALWKTALYSCNEENILKPEDYKKYEELLNTRVLWDEDGNYEIEVIEDKNERDIIDKQFLEEIAPIAYPDIIRIDEKYNVDYQEILAERVRKDLSEIDEDFIKDIDDILNPEEE